MSSRLVAVPLAALALLAAAPAARAACADSELPITAENVPKVRAALLCLLAEARAQAGASVLEVSEPLMRTAQDHAEDVAQRGPFSHTDADGKETDQRARERGYRGFAGENLAGGYSAQDAFNLLMDDPPHRSSLLGTGDDVGVGAAPEGPAEGFPIVSIVIGKRDAPEPEPQDPGSSRPVLYMPRLEREGSRVRVNGYIRHSQSGIKVRIRIKRGSRTIERTVRTMQDNWFTLLVKPPSGRGTVYVTATATVAGKKLVARRKLR